VPPELESNQRQSKDEQDQAPKVTDRPNAMQSPGDPAAQEQLFAGPTAQGVLTNAVLMTLAATVRRSKLRPRKTKGLAEAKPLFSKKNLGAGERNRTVDLRITNALLYQLSYTGLFCGAF
jgi:hypothetical protein